jgi:hypothetical protein
MMNPAREHPVMTFFETILRAFRGSPKPTLEERLAAIDWATLRWRFLHSWVNEHREIAPGCDIREETWQAVIDPATDRQRWFEAVDPTYGNTLRMWVSCIPREDRVNLFAATEVSNGVYLLFVHEPITSSSS